MKYARQLKDVGIRQDSMFYWIPVQRTGVLAYAPCMLDDTFQRQTYVDVEKLQNIEPHYIYGTYAAFTSEELARKIPEGLTHTKRHANKFYVYFLDSQGTIVNYEEDETEANARAKMLITLTKNNFIKNEKTK
tara:strand:+ start:335 stop:733 length:399 start_codon:yes stop_codon:yes gene_type:complete